MKLSDVIAARQVGEFVDENGVTWKLQRTPMSKTAEIRSLATPERKFNTETKKWDEQPTDVLTFKALKLAHSLLEPELEGDTIQDKAATIKMLLTEVEVQRLFEMTLTLDDLDLAKKVEEAAKN